MQIVFGVLGGLGLFLFGMQVTSSSLQKVAGTKFKKILELLTKNRFVAVLLGIIITFLIQSSSATTVMLVSFVSAKLMTLSQTFGVILGANIGTTLTVQLISLKVSDYALALVGVGYLLRFVKRRKIKEIGGVILGFGLIFFGMKIMSDHMIPLRNNTYFSNMLLSLAERPLLGLVISTLFTAVVQSSAATLGLAISLASQGLLGLDAAIPIIFGANIGTCATALLSSIGVNTEARKVAVAHVLFKIVGATIFFPLIPLLIKLTLHFGGDLPRQIANAHTILNVGITLFILPLVSSFAKWIDKLIPEEEKDDLSIPRYLDKKNLNTPAVAIDMAYREIIRVVEILKNLNSKCIDKIVNYNLKKLVELKDEEKTADTLTVEIIQYLSEININTLSEEEAEETKRLICIVNDLEHIGDIYQRIIYKEAEAVESDKQFSNIGFSELREIQDKIQKLLNILLELVVEFDREKAIYLIKARLFMRREEKRYRESHILRLQKGVQSTIETTGQHLDIIKNFQRISDHIANVAEDLLEREIF